MNKEDLIKMYSETKTELRKIRIIDEFIPNKSESILDLGCGNGLYGEFLKKKTNNLIGIDDNLELVNLCKTKGFYNEVYLKDIYSPNLDIKVTTIWASEIIEHLPSLDIFNQLENISMKLIIATLPNPLFPHYKSDPTHILNYSVKKLKNYLQNRGSWEYKIYGLGFENVPIPRFMKEISQKLLWNFPRFSPSLLIIGENK